MSKIAWFQQSRGSVTEPAQDKHRCCSRELDSDIATESLETPTRERGDIDSRTTRMLDTAERDATSNLATRETMVSQMEYDALAVGNKLDVEYRLKADDKSVEIIRVERLSP